MHHSAFKQYQTRTFWSYGHLAVGRLVIPLGIINGGLGLQWAANSNYGPIVYGVVAGIFGVAWLVVAILSEKRRSRNEPPKYEESPGPSGAPSSPRMEYYNDRR
jgi:hypothetical protein